VQQNKVRRKYAAAIGPTLPHLLQVYDRDVGERVRHVGSVRPRARLPHSQRPLIQRQRPGCVAALRKPERSGGRAGGSVP
jgi:hypothetical protein